jgi:hypothetical protein
MEGEDPRRDQRESQGNAVTVCAVLTQLPGYSRRFIARYPPVVGSRSMIPQRPKVEKEILLPLVELKGYRTPIVHCRIWIDSEH